MNPLRRVLRFVLLALVVAVVVVLPAAWWIVHRALPQLDGVASLSALRQEVTVDRDAWGVPHIRASSLEDLVAAQGYVLAQDRLWQMDILRRAAAGELSEVFGPATLELDREFRALGLRVAAERETKNLEPESRSLLEAYARGVNRSIEERRGKLPWEFVALRYTPRLWQLADSLLIAGYMFKTLTHTWEMELKRAQVTQAVGPERARELFVSDSALDHFIVGGEARSDKALARRERSPRHPAPPDPPSQDHFAELALLQRAGNGGVSFHPPDAHETPRAMHSEPAETRRAATAILAQFDEEVRAGLGSNNWVVDGTHTASGKPLLANDTHLPLGVPCVWYMVHLTAPGWNVKGFALPGAPLVIIGHNERIAWGYTNNGADVQDLYIETFNAANPLEYRVNGKWVAAQVRRERIRVRGRPDEWMDVVVTRHGPVVRREGGRAYALRWTATEPGGLVASYSMVGRARNWEEFRDAMRWVPGPAQNAVYADVDGNIGFLVAARIPVRKNGDGSMPVPADTDDFEWTDYIPFDELPQVLNPPGGVIATANARVVGPRYAHFLTDRWVAPYRTARIYALLADKKKLRPVDCITIQTDVVSLPHRSLAEQLARASQFVKPKDSRARELIGRLGNWDSVAAADSVEMSFVEYTRRALMRNLLRPYLGEEWTLYSWWRSDVFLLNTLRDQPRDWLPGDYASYAELLMGSADQAVRQLEAESGRAGISQWRWGRFIRLEMQHPLSRRGWLGRLLGVGLMEQPGAANTVKQTGRSFGPAMRFVADLADLDNSLMNLTTGESGQYGSLHYRDQFPAWFEGRGIASPFSDAAEEKARVHRLRLLPAVNPSAGR